MKGLRWLALWVVVALLALAALFFFGGRLLPQKYSVTRNVTVSAPPEKVFAVLESPRTWREWAAWPRRADKAPIYNYGRPSGGGSGIAFVTPTEGSMSIEVAAVDAPRRVAVSMTRPDVGASASSEFRIDARGPRTQVTWVVIGDVGRDPWHRWMVLLAAPLMAHDMEDSLSRLKARVEAN
jgi:uncharacterized protein YndB with AHSA1/START domain